RWGSGSTARSRSRSALSRRVSASRISGRGRSSRSPTRTPAIRPTGSSTPISGAPVSLSTSSFAGRPPPRRAPRASGRSSLTCRSGPCSSRRALTVCAVASPERRCRSVSAWERGSPGGSRGTRSYSADTGSCSTAGTACSPAASARSRIPTGSATTCCTASPSASREDPSMDLRRLGKTGLTVSTLGFGCGNVGGLIIRGTPAERERGVARAMELGVNYFDTAPSYGDGESERNLGQVLKALRARVYVGTKFRLDPPDLSDIPGAVARSLDAILSRLGMERVDLLQLHNRIEPARGKGALSLTDVRGQVVPAVQKLRQQGKVGFCGITALGETPSLHR